jgi:hypothetical protein
MEAQEWAFVDGKGLMGRNSRKTGEIGAVCYQFATEFLVSRGADLWGIGSSVLQKSVSMPRQSRKGLAALSGLNLNALKRPTRNGIPGTAFLCGIGD